ncbi:hypothetical protein BC834DRAFT_876671 [Gloeopeniophorella convolvens]|nr:hypothetical protein BC834DRAFT_876671 [Gloeopeniophorella convolvens]
MTMNILSLPTELILNILQDLPVRDVIACKWSCHRMHGIVEHSALLQPRIQPYVDRWEAAWQDFDIYSSVFLAHSQSIKFLGKVQHTFQNGYYVAVCGVNPDDPIPFGWSYLDVSTLLSKPPSQRTPSWTHIGLDPDLGVRRYALDTSQDLLAIIIPHEVTSGPLEVQLLGFTNGRHHTRAARPIFELGFRGQFPPDVEMQVEIMGRQLAVMVTPQLTWHPPPLPQSIYLIDWKTGQIHWVRRAYSYFPMLSFISSDLIVLGRKSDFSLEVCRITAAKKSGSLSLETLCILNLPPVQHGFTVSLNVLGNAPLGLNFPTSTSPMPRVPLLSSLEDSILCFFVDITSSDGSPDPEHKQLLFWTYAGTLRTLAECTSPFQPTQAPSIPGDSQDSSHKLAPWLKAATSALSCGVPVREWSAWGPSATRWHELLGRPSPNPSRATAGARAIVVENDLALLRVLDFDGARLAQLQARRVPRGMGTARSAKIVLEPSTIAAGSCFHEDITSALPYYEIMMLGFRDSRFFMDDEWLVFVDSTGYHAEQWIRVYNFTI